MKRCVLLLAMTLGAQTAQCNHSDSPSHPPMIAHRLISLADHGECLEMEDGSYWQVSASDWNTVLSWRVGDTLAISAHHSYFSPYAYLVLNATTESRIFANLIAAPTAFGLNTHWIVAIDPCNGHLFLENGSSWCISSNDDYALSSWEINDPVILGINDQWLSCYDAILINVNQNSFVRGRQY